MNTSTSFRCSDLASRESRPAGVEKSSLTGAAQLWTSREIGTLADMRKMMILAGLLLSSCDITGGVGHEERAWAASPDGRTHAILIETNGGATTAFGYLVELHPSDHQGQEPIRVADFYRVESDCEYGLDMRWKDANTLVLGVKSADQMHVAASADVGGKHIRVIVQTKGGDSAEPCQGMKGRPRKT